MKYWGDIHSHNNVGYGQGSAERALSRARASLDFCAITPHAWWPDLPDDEVRLKHVRGFRRTADKWAHTRRRVNEYNTPGTSVIFAAYERHSFTWGDVCPYFPAGYPRVARVSTFEKLIEHVRVNDALVVLHHCVYPVGRRGTNWDAIPDPDLRVAGIFSEHANSIDSPSPFPMSGHSMDGSTRPQTVLDRLHRGRRMGFLAGTDNHYGDPGAWGEGLRALYTPSLDRKSLFQALRNGNTYAGRGARIDVEFHANSDGSMAIPGDRLETNGTIEGALEVTGRARLRGDYPVGNRPERYFRGAIGRFRFRRSGSEEWPAGVNRSGLVRVVILDRDNSMEEKYEHTDTW